MSTYGADRDPIEVYLGEHELTVAVDQDVTGIRSRGDRLAVYRDVAPIASNYGLVDEQVGRLLPDAFETEYDDRTFTLRSTGPVPVPGTERYLGLVQDTATYEMRITDDARETFAIHAESATRPMKESQGIPNLPADSPAMTIRGTSLFRVDGVLDATRIAADRLFDLELEHDRF